MRGRGPRTPRGTRQQALRAALGLLAAAGALVAWLYASPPGSSPDDGYHLGSIWCGAGYADDRCLEAPGSASDSAAFVPAVLPQLTCVSGDGRRSAACQNDIYTRFEGRLTLSDTNLSGARATLYYRTANLLVSDDIPAAIARMRVMNASLVLLLVGLTAWLAAPDLRRAVLLSWLVTSVPLGLFIVTSLNSGAWGFVGLGTLWANAVTALRPGERWRRVAATGLMLVGATMSLGARTEAAAHLAVIVVALTILWATEIRVGWLRRPSPRQLVTLLGVGAAVVGGMTLALRSSALPLLLSFTSGFERGWDRLVARGISNPVATLAVETPQLWTGALGTWSLGWLDTNMPSTVSVSATVAFVTLAAFGLAGASLGRVASASVVFAGLLALPVLSLLSVGLVVLEELQPRHYAPLLYVLLGIALLRSPGQEPLRIGRGMRVVLAGALTIGQSVALRINIQRYTSGLTEFLYVDTNREVEWWWGGLAPSPEMVWTFGTIGYGVLAFLVLGLLTQQTGQSPRAAALRRPIE
jgi:hypothetical protein